MRWFVLGLLLLIFSSANASVLVIPPEYGASGDIVEFNDVGPCIMNNTVALPIYEGGTQFQVSHYYLETPPLWDRVSSYIIFNTTSLNGKTLVDAIFKMVVADTLTWGDPLPLNLDFRFSSDCIEGVLVEADTVCFTDGLPDTTILWDSYGIGDTLSIRIPNGKVNKLGITLIAIRSSSHKDICSQLTWGERYVLFQWIDPYPYGNILAPYLVVEYISGNCPCCHGSP